MTRGIAARRMATMHGKKCAVTGCKADRIGRHYCGLHEPWVDLSNMMGIDDFERVLSAIDYIVDASESLSLDDAADRETLKARLRMALGCVE